MRIVVISDTHTKTYSLLPESLKQEIASADAVIHAGDLGPSPFYEELAAASKKLYAVLGNNDTMDIPFDIVTTQEGVKIAVIHSDRARGNREKYLLCHFSADNPNLIIYGHTHRPHWVQYGEHTILNPGSPTRNRGVGYNTFVVLTLKDGRFDVDFRKAD